MAERGNTKTQDSRSTGLRTVATDQGASVSQATRLNGEAAMSGTECRDLRLRALTLLARQKKIASGRHDLPRAMFHVAERHVYHGERFG